MNATNLSLSTTIPLEAKLLRAGSFGANEYVTTSAPTSNGQNYRLIEISDASSSIIANSQVPLGFTPAALIGSLVYGVEQSTGQVLGVDPTTGSMVVRDLLTNGGGFTPTYAL